MPNFALDDLLAPIDGDSPTGPDLEYDAEFLALERAAAPKEERVMGDEVKAAEDPDWDSVQSMATALLHRSKDLRVAIHLGTAWMRKYGMPGWAAGLELCRSMVETYWDGVYPQLDAEDDNDPTSRVNAILAIATHKGALGYFQTTPFVQSPRMGRYSLRDIRVANGEAKPLAGANTPSIAEIEACCMDCAEEDFDATSAAINESLERVRAIDKIFNDQVGTLGPDLKPLITDLVELKRFVDPMVARRHPGEGMEGEVAGDAAPAAGGGVAAVPGRINGPQDVVRRIDEICEYYQRSEPSSPIPLLLRRAQRLVGLSFEDLMKDLAPSGINELQNIAGSTE